MGRGCSFPSALLAADTDAGGLVLLQKSLRRVRKDQTIRANHANATGFFRLFIQ
jgi:hypothetical protein